jgi:copper transport protein
LGAVAAVAAGLIALPVTTAYQQGGGLTTVADPATWAAVGGAEVLGLVTLVAGLALVLVPRRGTRPAAVARVPLLAGITLVVLSPALTGHSRAFDPQLPVIVTDALHVLAGSIWLGGLVGLALTLPALGGRGQAAAEVLTRFSTAAAAVLVALIAAGCLLAWRILGSWESLLGTTYGRLLLAKIAVVAVAVALAAGNRYLLLPRLRAAVGHADRQSGAAKMSQAVTVEAVVVVAAIAVTGFLVNQSPGAATPTVRDGRSGVQTAQLGELRVLAIMTPRAPGTNTVLVQLQDATGEPVEPTRLPEVRVGSDTVNLGEMPVTSCDTGTYCAEVMLPTAGRWVVQVSLRVSEFENPVAAVTFRVPPG